MPKTHLVELTTEEVLTLQNMCDKTGGAPIATSFGPATLRKYADSVNAKLKAITGLASYGAPDYGPGVTESRWNNTSTALIFSGGILPRFWEDVRKVNEMPGNAPLKALPSKSMPCGLSWGGFNLEGDVKSIDEVKRLQAADERLKALDARLNEAKSAKLNSNEKTFWQRVYASSLNGGSPHTTARIAADEAVKVFREL